MEISLISIVVWRQFVVTDGIDSKRGLFNFTIVENTVAGRNPQKIKHDQQLDVGKLYSTCSSQYET